METLQKFHKKAFAFITISGFAVIGLCLWLQENNITDSYINNYISLISGSIFLVSAIISLKYYKKIGDRGGISKAILWTGISNLLFFIGSVTWAYYNLFLHIELPYPSFADLFFVLMPLCYGVAVGNLMQIYRSSTRPQTWVVAILIFVGLVYTMFNFVGKPEISSELDFWTNFFNFGYALSDSIYVGAGFALLIVAGGKIFKGILVWTLGMFLITIADLVFTYRDAIGLLWNGDIADQLYTLSAIIFTYAVILLSKMTEQNKINI
jgi:hypothetical protein